MSSEEKSEKENGLNLDSFMFEKVQMKKAVSLDDKDIQFNFSKQKTWLNDNIIEPVPTVNIMSQKSPVINRIEEAYEVQEKSPYKNINFD